MSGIISNVIYKYFNGRDVLKGVSFGAKPQSITLIVGRNGAGKTTWLRIAIGLIKASSGDVNFNGCSVEKVRNNIACVFDEPPVYPNLSGEENLRFIATANNIDGDWLNKIKKMLNLETSFLNMKARQYSLGQKRRLAVAAAIARKPKYLFLDEPAIGLDPLAWDMVKNSINELVSQNSVVVLTSQDFNHLEDFVNKVVFFRDGIVVFDGDLRELKARRPPKVRVETLDVSIIKNYFPEAKIINNSKSPEIEINCVSIYEAEKVISLIQGLDIKLKSLRLCEDSLQEAFIAIENERASKE